MRKFILSLIFILSVSIQTYSQTITLTSIGTQNVSGIPVTVDHYVTTANGTTSVKIYRTHYGNGNTSQYATYPGTRAEMNKLFNTAYAATTLWWSGNMSATASLNFYQFTTLTNAGASVPPNGDYYATEVTFTFVAAETGTYSFGLTSDDGSDLAINGTSVIEWYGGKGTGQYKYGNYSMVAGTQYTVVARMQEYGGGDGLVLVWRRPSQGSWSLQLSEIGVTSNSWVSQGTKNTNASGQVSWTNSSNWPYRVTVDVTNNYHTLTDADMNYLMYKKAGLSALQSWDFYTCDINNSTVFDYDDLVFGYVIWSQGHLHNKYVFTKAQRDAIVASPSTNFYTTYSPIQTLIVENQNQFYIMGTGKHQTTINNLNKIQ